MYADLSLDRSVLKEAPYIKTLAPMRRREAVAWSMQGKQLSHWRAFCVA
jgi:hypothetical protein